MRTDINWSRLRSIAAGSIAGAVVLGTLVSTPAVASELVVGPGPTASFRSIDSAVAHANPGDTITIEPGTYTENVVIDIPVTLRGANAGTPGTGNRGDETIIISPDSTRPAITAAEPITLDGVEISQQNITSTTSNVGVELDEGSEGSILRNSIFMHAAHGVVVKQGTTSGTSIIEKNSFSDLNVSGVHSLTSHGLVVESNTINADTSNGTGVLLANTNVDALVSENTIAAATGVKSTAQGTDPTTGLNIEKNTIDASGPKTVTAGIQLAERNELGSRVSGNKITANGNKFGVNVTGGPSGTASATNLTIAGNTIEGMAWAVGLSDVGEGAKITDNTMTAQISGIRNVNTDLSNFEISGNTITTTDDTSTSGNATIYAQSSMTNGKIINNTLTTKGTKGLTGAVVSDVRLTDVLIDSNTMSSYAAVISRDSTRLTISGNTTQTALAAVYLFYTQDGLSVTGNDFGGDRALLVANAATFTTAPIVTGNAFRGTRDAGVNAQVAGLVAKGNYWSNGGTLYPVKLGAQEANLSQALPIDPMNGDDNTPKAAPATENAPTAQGSVAAGKLSVNLKGVSALGLAGAAASAYYPYTVEGGEWVKVYFVGAKTWSKWVQAPASGVVVVDAPAGVSAAQGVVVVNFAGDTIAAVKGSSLSFAPSIVTDKLPAGVVGKKYSSTITATGTAPITISAAKESLPKGLTLTSATDGTATITGTPASAGTFKFTLTASNAIGEDTREYSVTFTKEIVKPAVCSEPRRVPVFADAPLGHKFYKEIDWMECMKYSTGWKQASGKPLYKPKDDLQRSAMAAFIYRMEAEKGYQAPKVSPFADVKTGDKFYKEIAWMYEKGLSTGWKEASGKPTFRPSESLSREAMAAFIYRLEAPAKYTAPKTSPLADMKPGMAFYKEISWMYGEGLTTGNKTTAGKEFLPKDSLSRQAMAAFIYRLVTVYRK